MARGLKLTGEVAAGRVMVMIFPFLGADFRSGEMTQMDNTRQADDPSHPRARGNAGPGGSRVPKAATYFAYLKGYRFRSAALPDLALNEKRPSPFEPGPHLTSWSNYFLTFAFLARAADP